MSRNEELFERAKQHIPGGVNSPVRAFGSVGGAPRFIRRANGPFVWDADDKQFIDSQAFEHFSSPQTQFRITRRLFNRKLEGLHKSPEFVIARKRGVLAVFGCPAKYLIAQDASRC